MMLLSEKSESKGAFFQSFWSGPRTVRFLQLLEDLRTENGGVVAVGFLSWRGRPWGRGWGLVRAALWDLGA